MVIDGARLEEFLHGPTGAVNIFLMTRAEIVKQAAKIQAAKNGRIADYIVKRPVEESATGLSITIICQHPAAVWVHNGTQPHVIQAKNASTLAFVWAKGPFGTKGMGGTGKHFYFSVNHPGYKGNPFLADNLKLFFS